MQIDLLDARANTQSRRLMVLVVVVIVVVVVIIVDNSDRANALFCIGQPAVIIIIIYSIPLLYYTSRPRGVASS